MATTLYLREVTATTTRGTNTNGQAGSAKDWRVRSLQTFNGNTTTTATVSTVNGPTSGLEFGAPALEWLSSPLAASATISGTATLNLVAHESNALANATIAVLLQRLDAQGAIQDTIVNTSFGTELGTSAAARNWTAVPTSTTINKGDRLRLVAYTKDATSVTMATGYTVTLTYANTAAAQSSYITLAENLTFDDAWWYEQTTGTTNQYWAFDLAYGSTDDLFVAVGQTGQMTRSSDGATWTGGTSSTTSFIRTVTYELTPDRWVYGGDSGLLRYSDDGLTWTAGTSNTTATFYGFAYSTADSRWVGVATGGVIRYSSNAVTWSTATSGTTSDFYAVGYGGTTFVAAGASGNIRTSTDGTAWTNRSVSVGTQAFFDVLYVADWSLWLASGDLMIYYSSDAVTWTLAINPGVTIIRLAYSSGDGVALGVGSGGNAYTSSDGKNWTKRLSPIANTIRGAAYSSGDDRFVVTLEFGHAYTTPDALTANGFAQQLYVTDTASDIADQGTVEQKLWTSRGTG